MSKSIFLIFYLFTLLFLTIAAVDDSLTDRARGMDVVKVVVDKIRNSQIFPDDFNFLQRMAYVETKFGTDRDTFRLNYYGGIWAVRQQIFDATKDTVRFPILATAYTKILQQLQINWQLSTWVDLTKPLYSGLAVSLYAMALSPTISPISQRLSEQASFWNLNLNSNPLSKNEASFVALVEEMRSTAQFNCKMDLVVVLDESGSIGPQNYTLALQSVSSLFNFYSLETVREGFMTFSTDNKLVFPLANSFTSAELAAIIAKVVYVGGGTNTNSAIAFAINMFQTAGTRAGVPKVMVLFTDGKSTDGGNVSNSLLAKAAGITSIAVGIADYNLAELNVIADGVRRRVVTLRQFDTLIEIIGQLSTSICEVPQRPVLNSVTNDGLAKGEKRIYNFDLTSQDGITVYLNTSSGKVKGYYSYDYESPSAALYDGVLVGDSSVIPGLTMGGGVQGKTVYIAIQGVEDNNDYTIKAVEGQHLPPYVCFPALQLIQEDLGLIRRDIGTIKESIRFLTLNNNQQGGNVPG